MSEPTKPKIAAPYASWITFKGFISDLVAKGMPNRIDSTVMAGKSGSSQSTIRRTLAFLKLTTGQEVPTSKLKKLVAVYDTDEWPTALRPIVIDAYSAIVEDLDLETGTAKQLADCFRNRGNVTGNTLTMAVRFFLAALAEAGVPHSSYFKAPARPAKKSPTPKTSDGAKETDLDSTEEDETGSHAASSRAEHPDSAWPSQPFLLPTREEPIILVAPKDMTGAEWNLIDVFVRGMIELADSKVPPPSDDTENGG